MKTNNRQIIILTVIFFSILASITFSFAQQNSLFKQIPDEIKRYNFYKRFEWFMAPRIFPFDSIAIRTYFRELNRESKFYQDNLRFTNFAGQQAQPTWSHLGPTAVASGDYYSGRARPRNRRRSY